MEVKAVPEALPLRAREVDPDAVLVAAAREAPRMFLELASGRAHVAGTVTIDGTATFEIELATGVVGYFDTTHYRPMYLDNPQRDGGVVRTRVVTFEELPMTPCNAKLLSITAQHPRARVLTRSASGK